MNHEHIRTFLEVAATANLNRAAERLIVGQPLTLRSPAVASVSRYPSH
jgi:DNA-binding transcriptional LysR family regulator